MQRYALALETLPLAAAPQCDLAALSKHNVDLEAMELALRRNNPYNFLTQRFLVLCYLVEARPDYFHRFVNDRPRFLAEGSHPRPHDVALLLQGGQR